MDSSDSLDSPNLRAQKVLPNNEKNCAQLFDEIFNNNIEDDNELNVQKPTRTYQRNAKTIKTVKFFEDEDDDDDDDDSDDDENIDGGEHENDENFVPLFKEKEKKQRKKGKNRKMTYPNVSKDAVMEAWNKAVESKELPDFDEIDKFPLSIVTEKSPKQKDRKRKQTQSATNKRTSTRSKKIQQPSVKKVASPKTNVDKENLPTTQQPKKSVSNKRKSVQSTRGKPVLREKCINQQNSENPKQSEKELFDLDESCIRPALNVFEETVTNKTNDTGTMRISISNGKGQIKNDIKSSTPFGIKTNQLITEKTRRTLRSTTRGNLFH